MSSNQDLSIRVRNMQKKIIALHNQLKKEREMLKKERDLTGSMARTAAQQFLMEDRPSSMSYEKWKASLLLESSSSRVRPSCSSLLPVSSRGDSGPTPSTGKPFQYQPLKDLGEDLTLKPFALRPQSPPQGAKACVHWHTHTQQHDAGAGADTEVLFMKDGDKKLLFAHKRSSDVAERRPRYLPVPIWTNHKFGNRDTPSGLQSNSFL